MLLAHGSPARPRGIPHPSGTGLGSLQHQQGCCGPASACLGTALGHLAVTEGHLGPSCCHAGAVLLQFGPVLGHLGPSWVAFGLPKLAWPVSRQRVDPAALPLGSQRSRTQTPFSRWRRLAVAEIHGVESPKPGAEIGFSEFCTTPIRNPCFLHKWPSRLRGGGFHAALGRCRGLPDGGLKTIKNVKLSQISGS